MSGRHQTGYIWRKGHFWYGRWYEDILVDGQVKRKARARKLAPYNDRYRNEKDVRPILDDILRPINNGQSSPYGAITIAKFYEGSFYPHIKAERKPSTAVAYDSIWKPYLSPLLQNHILRDFRCVDATKLLSDIHRKHSVGRKTLRNCKALLSSIFTYAKQSGILDGINPVKDAAIPSRAAKAKSQHATSLDEFLAILDALEAAAVKEKGSNAEHLRIGRRAIALMFFCGLRPGEARGCEWKDYDGKHLLIRQAVWRTNIDIPKTPDSIAKVPVSKHLKEILDEDRQPDGYMLAGTRTGRPIHLSNLSRRYVRPALEKRNIAWYGWYAMRRGIGTLATSEESPLAAKGLLRHANVATTEQFYIKDVPEDTQRAVQRIDELLDAKRKQKESAEGF
jgi:integrase